MCVVMIFVDDQQRPLSIWPQHCVRGNQVRTVLIQDVALYPEKAVRLIDRLYPFAGDELSRKILREQTLDLEVAIHLDGTKTPSARIAPTPHGFRYVVVVVGGGAAAG